MTASRSYVSGLLLVGLVAVAACTSSSKEAAGGMVGSKRYNEGSVITLGGAGSAADGGAQQAACTNCHGPTADGPFKAVAHTPEQTGGFSDQELTDIFVRGTVPQGGYFDANIVPYALWQAFHQWDVGEAAKGVVVYLRSLTPAAQKGSFNIGAFRDAGARDAEPPGTPDAGPNDQTALADTAAAADAGTSD